MCVIALEIDTAVECDIYDSIVQYVFKGQSNQYDAELFNVDEQYPYTDTLTNQNKRDVNELNKLYFLHRQGFFN